MILRVNEIIYYTTVACAITKEKEVKKCLTAKCPMYFMDCDLCNIKDICYKAIDYYDNNEHLKIYLLNDINIINN